MKKVSKILTFLMLFTLSSVFHAYSDEGIFTMLCTGDDYTQTNALALSVRSLNLGYEVKVDIRTGIQKTFQWFSGREVKT